MFGEEEGKEEGRASTSPSPSASSSEHSDASDDEAPIDNQKALDSHPVPVKKSVS